MTIFVKCRYKAPNVKKICFFSVLSIIKVKNRFTIPPIATIFPLFSSLSETDDRQSYNGTYCYNNTNCSSSGIIDYSVDRVVD